MVELDGHRISLDIVKSVLPTNIEIEKGADFVRHVPGTLIILNTGDKFKVKKKPDVVWDMLQKDEGIEDSTVDTLKSINKNLGIIAEQLGRFLVIAEHGTLNISR